MLLRLRNRLRASDLFNLVALVAASLLVCACSSQAVAPSGVGVCWRGVDTANPKASFRVFARNVPNLESCAAQLEGARMLDGAPVTGAFNRHFIFATEDQITAGRSLDGNRIRVFDAEDRRKIQDGLRTLIEHERRQAPPAT